jgi:hypothetical protein
MLCNAHKMTVSALARITDDAWKKSGQPTRGLAAARDVFITIDRFDYGVKGS